MRIKNVWQASLLAIAVCAAAGSACAYEFSPIVFGQSTDLNFATNVLPEKIGMNEVRISGQALSGPQELVTPFEIESRGGKIGNSHDGLTFYFTKLPSSKNFALEATVRVEAIGPENGALPAGQEGCGLLVRDVLGPARESSVKPGIEEFPAASNMVMTAVMSDGNADHTTARVVQIERNGVTVPWGNPGVKITRTDAYNGLNLKQSPVFKLRLERTDAGFISGFAQEGSEVWEIKECAYPSRLSVIDDDYYLGFFASRNAKMQVLDVKLSTSEAAVDKSVFKPEVQNAYAEVLSSPVAADGEEYELRLRTNQDGIITVKDSKAEVKAGKITDFKIRAEAGDELSYTFTALSGKQYAEKLQLVSSKVKDPNVIFAAPNGTAEASGTAEDPCDIVTALASVKAGGTVKLLPGTYSYTVLDSTLSGKEGALKKLAGTLGVIFEGLELNASYLEVEGIEVTGKSFKIAGSYNRIVKVRAHHCDDTGIWVASPDYAGRALWASYNTIEDCISYQNQDPGNINADGFAVKMRVGEGNLIRRAVSFANADDGYDLFNKIEDGPNGAVAIVDSLAFGNKNNGFKLGGEGLPAPHSATGCISYKNGMDGFTDNFNPGQLKLSGNISADNTRYNFIFRKGPFTKNAQEQGVFEENVSIRTASGGLPDVVNGDLRQGNIFLFK